MKTLHIIVVTLAILTLFRCNLEKVNDYGLPNDVKFKTGIGGPWSNNAYDIIVTTEGKYVVAGDLYNNQNNNYQQAFLGLISGTGEVLGQFEIGESGTESISAVTESTSGDFIACGFLQPPFGSNNQLLIVKVRKDFSNTVWQKFFSSLDSSYYGIGIIPSNAGGYLVLYSANSNNSNMTDFKLMKIDENGNKVFDKLLITGYMQFRSMTKTLDGGFVASGDESIYYSQLYKWNASGVFQWQGRYPLQNGNGANFSNRAIESGDGNFYVSGYNSYFDDNWNQNQVLLFSNLGTFIHQDSWGDTLDNKLIDLVESDDGHLVVLGSEGDDLSKPYSIFISKRVKQTGVEIWKKELIKGFPLYGRLRKCSDGGYIVACSSYYTPNEILVIKTDKDGNFE